MEIEGIVKNTVQTTIGRKIFNYKAVKSRNLKKSKKMINKLTSSLRRQNVGRRAQKHIK